MTQMRMHSLRCVFFEELVSCMARQFYNVQATGSGAREKARYSPSALATVQPWQGSFFTYR